MAPPSLTVASYSIIPARCWKREPDELSKHPPLFRCFQKEWGYSDKCFKAITVPLFGELLPVFGVFSGLFSNRDRCPFGIFARESP